ncbi:hypothetical protein Tsubulata_013981 [Turnera subulata]|uniref:Receptor-like serine/threonine-protein kinase n=1 Tax=Turnera subulata TaxID=218843 RepID=A0A9Q0F252_9ROSI|nr:hypothetical protein Tsubulata_013981 [Turnera subulata]
MDYSILLALLICSSSLLNLPVATAIDSIDTTQSLKDGDNSTIVSADGTFALGFFSPGSSTNRYLGIWYSRIPVQTVVWVANRDAPLSNSSVVLRINSQGVLVLLQDQNNGRAVWSSSNPSTSARQPVAQLLDSGNLVVKDEGGNNPQDFLWQSFDHPTDTLLPEMKLGRDTVTGVDRYLTSWKTPDDPSPGNFTYRLNPAGFPDTIVREGSIERYRSGPWNGMRFSGTPQLKLNSIYTYGLVFNDKELYFRYQLINSTLLSRFVINQGGVVQNFIWVDRTRGWELYLALQTDNCDRYALCGAYGSCSIFNSPVCGCLNGFEPRNQNEWGMMDWSSGCVRKTRLDCSGDGFQKYSGMKLPETKDSWFDRNMSLEECKNMCMKNCSCTAYTNLDITNGGSGCLLWFSELIDLRQLTENGQDIYLRMAASELDNAGTVANTAKSNSKKQLGIVVGSVLSAAIVLIGLACVFYICRKKKKDTTKLMLMEPISNDDSKNEDLELPSFGFGVIAHATNHFSGGNKLGEGGFGPVYKGILKDGHEIAVKRLSKTSRQGLDEFKNEVKYIAKLQHRNLVKLLGCCIEADEMMLVYEFMPNKSLDFFLFDEARSKLLDWPKRFHIINGIARGLLYLHQDSRLRVIHRDLKASNVLLDYEMNPKISDFGLARSFGGNETEANTNNVVGTYGYISPEYAIDGLYSVKSDVYSFGVLLLEIVSGKRNRGFYHPEHRMNLLGHAWTLFNEGKAAEMTAESIVETCDLGQVLRCIHVGLLCVQRSPKDRPSMASVVLMLGSEGELPQPTQPGFYTINTVRADSPSPQQSKSHSANAYTITIVEAR